MLIGYARVSTQDQNLDRQLDQLKVAGCERIYQEKITGAKRSRPELAKLLENIRTGDVIVIADLTRLSRSTKDLLYLVGELEAKKANVKSLKENWVDTTTAQGKLMFTIISGLSQFERDLTSERTKEGLAAARARGRVGGRKPVDPKVIDTAIRMYNSKAHSISEICKTTGISKMTLYRYLP